MMGYRTSYGVEATLAGGKGEGGALVPDLTTTVVATGRPSGRIAALADAVPLFKCRPTVAQHKLSGWMAFGRGE
jgi:hypothetical protein